ncbi:hypothetical protein [Streptomyces sp. MST-110588]|uniref:hypothetical protein n=1 Tax=Streptomyces sp. MST-110588 TaxID=2833628 RepID=UPI001F5D6E61|nr:hypothetical protein [Streptomyces sp. MST-110588]UNO41626.1 hypothetical protein KGS77_21340 [Streptomyces sp. MST-110588]
MEAAQRALDEEQRNRARLLAAMAVTVGSDGAVAGFLGLGERTVRAARRTVGRVQGRETAEQLLAHAASQRAPSIGEAASLYQGEEPQVVPLPQQEPMPVPEEPAPPPEQQQPKPAAASGTPWWTPSMDAVLVQGWWAGLDPQVLADQLGMDLHSVMLRVQQLSVWPSGSHSAASTAAYPEPTVVGQEDRGRHRRRTTNDAWAQHEGDAQVAYLPRQQMAPGSYGT